MVVIREASLEDIEGIAKVHVDSWRSTYKGIISEAYLSRVTLEKRKKNWLWKLHNLNTYEKIFVAEEDKGRIVGFSNGGRNRTEHTEYDGELYALYILKEFQGIGLGKKLVGEIMDTLRKKNYDSMMVWVLESNPAIGFYRKLGGIEFTRKDIEIGQDVLIEVALGWKNIISK